MTERLLYDYAQRHFLVLEQGAIASSFYLPPLLGFNTKQEYGGDNFMRALMVADSEEPQLMIFIKEKRLARRNYFLHPCYVHDIDVTYEDVNTGSVTFTRILYNIPRQYHADYHIFAAGKYSEMSDDAKAQIRLYSGGNYKKPAGVGKYISDRKLLVLDKSPLLRAFLEKILAVTIDDEAELLDRPGVDDYWVS